jgi:YHS domain-containing protein
VAESDLIALNNRIRQLLSEQQWQSRWPPENVQRYMAEFKTRSKQFEQTAERLIEQIVRPRLETIAGYFPNAGLSEREPLRRCNCWFGYCERFPASAQIAFSFEHDVSWRRAYLRYEAHLMPCFVNINEQDRLELSLEQLDEAQVAAWVEDRLVEFLDAYLQIDRGPDDAEEETVTDPVCGMRIARTAAAASFVHRGHPYFFCSDACQRNFADAPSTYVQFKAL